MMSRAIVTLALVGALALFATDALGAPAKPAAEYSQHFDALSALSIAVAKAMPPGEYAFRPDPPSMSFGEQISHVASTNYDYCAGLKDSDLPAKPSPKDKDGIVKFLSDSFDYCSAVIPNLTDEQLNQYHDSPDGRLLGREILLVMYVHVAHHRGQAEVYLRDKGIAPPSFRF